MRLSLFPNLPPRAKPLYHFINAPLVACVQNTGPVPEIERDLAAARALGVNATPTFVVNGKLIEGGGRSTLESLVERELRARHSR